MAYLFFGLPVPGVVGYSEVEPWALSSVSRQDRLQRALLRLQSWDGGRAANRSGWAFGQAVGAGATRGFERCGSSPKGAARPFG